MQINVADLRDQWDEPLGVAQVPWTLLPRIKKGELHCHLHVKNT